MVPRHLDLRPLAEELDLRRLVITQFESPSTVAQVAVGGATRINRAVRAVPPPSPHKVTQAVEVVVPEVEMELSLLVVVVVVPTVREQLGKPVQVQVTVGRARTSATPSEPYSARRAYSPAEEEEAMMQRQLVAVSAE